MRIERTVRDLETRLTLAMTRLTLPADRSGATGIEYALIAAGVALVLVAAMALIGPEINRILQAIGVELQGAGQGG